MEKEKEKVEKYQDLRREIARLWKLGSVTKEFNKWIGKIRLVYYVGMMQNTALLGTARILRKVLEM